MYVCPLCKGEKFLPKENAFGETERIPCECQISEYKKIIDAKMLKVSHLPERSWNYTTSLDGKSYADLLTVYTPTVTKIEQSKKDELLAHNKVQLQIIIDYINNPKSFADSKYSILWVWGKDPNAGRSSLVCLLGKALLIAGYRVRYYDMESLVKLILEFKDKDVMAEIDSAFDRYDIIIVDDALDRDKCYLSNNEYVKTSIYGFFKRAVDKNKKLICTSRCDIDGIQEDYVNVVSLFIRSFKAINIRGTLNTWLKTRERY